MANFVLMDYGTGALFGVPAHDARDFEFAKKYHLPIRRVVAENMESASETVVEPEPGQGITVNSHFLDGMPSRQASAEVIKRAEAAGWGKGKTQYRLRDWGVSRQRYWGTPIPVIHCQACGPVPVPEKDLPVVLPEGLIPDGSGNPLNKYEPFLKCTCPKCKKGDSCQKAKAEKCPKAEAKCPSEKAAEAK
jgi:leucyl-tRNA synthetase